MKCHHCAHLFGTEERDKVAIQRIGGKEFLFHTECFTKIAGEEYVPPTFIDPWISFFNRVPERVCTNDELKAYAAQIKKLPKPITPLDRDGMVCQLEADLKQRVPAGIAIDVHVRTTIGYSGVNVTITLRANTAATDNQITTNII